MYQENGGFDQIMHGGGVEHPFSSTDASAALEMELHRHSFNTTTISDMVQLQDSSNWQETTTFNHHHQLNPAAENIYDAHHPMFLPPPPPAMFPHSTQTSPAFGGAAAYDPLLPLNLPPQPPLLRELFHGAGAYSHGSFFNNGVDEREANLGFYQNGDVFEFTAADIGKSKDTKHFATERHRRVLLNDKYQALRKLVPTPTKNDRASIVGDAIGYINELKMTVSELKGLVEKKRSAKEMLKRPKTEENSAMDSLGDMNGPSLRSSWLHRKSKNTEVDVQIIDDEVTVKLVQQKRINCLMFVSQVLDELQLDLHHVAGGAIGDYYSYLFNSKICEGSIVYASAVANKLIEVVDKQYAAVAPTSF